MEKKLGLEFEILHDAENRVAEEYGLKFELPEPLRGLYDGFGINLPKHHGSDRWELPMPSRYVIAADGRVIDAVVHPDYTRRPEPQDTLAKLRGLQK